MRKFFKFAFKPHIKEVVVILFFSILQAYFQLQIIDLFKTALSHVKSEDVSLLTSDGWLMLIYTIFFNGIYDCDTLPVKSGFR